MPIIPASSARLHHHTMLCLATLTNNGQNPAELPPYDLREAIWQWADQFRSSGAALRDGFDANYHRWFCQNAPAHALMIILDNANR